MRRKLIPLLTVLALLLVAAGGAAAAGDTGTTDTPDATPDSGDAGICLVGADSPCNDAPADDSDTGTDANESTRGEPLGDDAENESTDDAGICLVGADSPCNHGAGNGTVHIEPEPDERTPPTHPTPSNGEYIGSEGEQDDRGRMWIPEDQNRDGDIDDRFHGGVGPLADLLSSVVGAL